MYCTGSFQYRLQNSVFITSCREKLVYSARFHKAKKCPIFCTILETEDEEVMLSECTRDTDSEALLFIELIN